MVKKQLKINFMKKVVAYRCNYCSKIHKRKTSCKSHEENCYYNPDTNTCNNCMFLHSVGQYSGPGVNQYYIKCLLNNKGIPRKLKTVCGSFSPKNDPTTSAINKRVKDVLFEKNKPLESIYLELGRIELYI